MKGIVAEINGKYTIVLTQDGLFQKVKTVSNMTVGKEIDLDQPTGIRSPRLVMKVTSIAAAGLLAIGVGFGAYSYTMPYSYVHLDINPSIELVVNAYDRIIRAEALNEDGKKLLQHNSLNYERLEKGVAELLVEAVEQGYLSEDKLQTGSGKAENERNRIENAVLFTVSSNNIKKSDELKKEIAEAALKELDKDKVPSEILVGEASVEQRDAAKKLGVTPGKLSLIEDAMADEPQLQFDDLKNEAVRDLLKKASNRKIKDDKQNTEKNQLLEEEKEKDKDKDKEGNKRQGNTVQGITDEPAMTGVGSSDEADMRKPEGIEPEQPVNEGNGKGNANGRKGDNNQNTYDKKSENDMLNDNGKNNIKEQREKNKAGEKTGKEMKKEREQLKNNLLEQIKDKEKVQLGNQDKKNPSIKDKDRYNSNSADVQQQEDNRNQNSKGTEYKGNRKK